MKDEEIIKAFEYCTNTKGSCKTCCYSFIRNGELTCNHKKRNKDILEIINRLKVENEKLKAEIEAKLEKALEHNESECKRCMEKVEVKQIILIEIIEERVRKETAKEILQTLYNYPHEYHESKIKELAKQYGVEVGE